MLKGCIQEEKRIMEKRYSRSHCLTFDQRNGLAVRKEGAYASTYKHQDKDSQSQDVYSSHS